MKRLKKKQSRALAKKWGKWERLGLILMTFATLDIFKAKPKLTLDIKVEFETRIVEKMLQFWIALSALEIHKALSLDA